MASQAALDNPVRHEFVRANGLQFHVAECGDPESDRLALLLHGFPESWVSWRHQLPLFARLGWRCQAPDLRGYGTSDKPSRVADYAIEKLLDDVAGLIDASGAKHVALVAHDWGAIIAWYFATRRIRPLERLVIMNVPHPGAAEKRRSVRQLLRSWYMFFFQLPWLPELMVRKRAVQGILSTGLDERTFPPDIAAIQQEAIDQPGAPRGMVNYYRALLRGGFARQRAQGFPVIDTPTLMIWGEDDVALRKELTYHTGDFVSDLTLRYLPGISHWVQQHDPGTVNAMIEAWLAGEPVPEAEGVQA